MSHTTTLRAAQIRDLNALSAAVAELQGQGIDIQLETGGSPRMYYQTQKVACDLVLRLPKSRFDVGLKRQDDGTYVPIFDEFANHVGEQIGAACPLPSWDDPDGRALHQLGRLTVAYAKHATRNAAGAAGYFVEGEHVDEAGNTHLVLVA